LSNFAFVNKAQIHSWNQPVLSNKGKISCSRKQLEPLVGLELTTDPLWCRHSTLFAMPGCFSCLVVYSYWGGL